jgi:hypothetical protein
MTFEFEEKVRKRGLHKMPMGKPLRVIYILWKCLIKINKNIKISGQIREV